MTMKSIKVEYNSKAFSVKPNMIALWLHRFELAIYLFIFSTLMYAIYTKSASKYEVKVGVIIALSIALIIVVIYKRKSVIGEHFSILRTIGGFCINSTINIAMIDLESILVKESVSTYSAEGYYDIALPVGGKSIPVAFGLPEDEKDELLRALRSFLSNNLSN